MCLLISEQFECLNACNGQLEQASRAALPPTPLLPNAMFKASLHQLTKRTEGGRSTVLMSRGQSDATAQLQGSLICG